MERFDFDREIERRHTNCSKWDRCGDEGLLPMWVADMDFQAAPVIIEAIQRRAAHGVFGYTCVPDRYYQAVIHWFDRRHGLHIEKEWVTYTTGVVPAITAIIKALTEPGDKVMVQTPVYNCFFSAIRNNGCEIASSPLIHKGGSYEMDYDSLEKVASDPKVKLMLLCSPHNPAGRVWTREELKRLNDICMKHGVLVIADEIHCELVFPGYKFVPFASVSQECLQNSVTCNSPSKSFNIAGLQISNIITPDEMIRKKIERAIEINQVGEVNPFGVEGLIAAYEEGEEWLKALIAYLYENYKTLRFFLEKELPELKVTEMEGTYLVWVDCRALGISSEKMKEDLLRAEKLWLNSGDMYGEEGYMRINIACPRRMMLEGLERLRRYVRGLRP